VGVRRGGRTAEMVADYVEAHSSLVGLLVESDGHIRAFGAVGLDEDVPRLLIGAHVVLVKGLPICQVANRQQGAGWACKPTPPTRQGQHQGWKPSAMHRTLWKCMNMLLEC
jgi:hypothetical protein